MERKLWLPTLFPKDRNNMKVYKSLPRITIASYPSPSILDSIKGRKKYAYKDLLLRESSKITQTMLVKWYSSRDITQ